jgi:hypothetical protein
MNTEAVKTFYDLLGHKKQTEIRAIELSKDFKTSKVKGHYFVSSKKEFIDKIKEFDGKYNLYAGLNERIDKGTEAKDVISVKRIFADIDCITKPASAEDLKEAEKVTDTIISKIEEKTGLRATKIYSGNGYQLVFCIPEIEITEANREEVQAQVQQFLKDLIKKYSNDKVKLDNVGDLPRIIRITGTTNIKGGKTSEFIEVHKEENSKLREYILSLKPETSLSNIKVAELETSFKEILEKDERVKNLFEGNINKFASRSEAEQSLVCHLIGLGFDKEQIFKVMASCKIGKWQTANIQYRELTYKKALEIIKKEKPKSEDRIKSFLIEDRQKYESLGCGCLDGVYYFGTKLFREGKPYTAIITSDKKCYLAVEKINEISNYFGLNYKDNFYDEGLDNILSKEAIQKWLYEKTNDITLKSIYEKLVKIFKKYIYLDDERKYSLLACYRIASFFMPVWRARARLFLYAEMGSAKSRLTQIMHNTGFNSIALGDWTLAYLQRLIESTRGETHIDDYETLDEDKKNATTRLIKTGFMKGFKAGKISEGKNRKPETYDLFNTTTLNNTEGLDFISTDRCITIRIPKISKKEYDREPNFSEPIWKEVRDELYVLGLKYPQEVALTYEAITSDKIRGRLFFIIKPELTIAKLISEELYQQLEDFWSEEIEQRQNIDFETDWEFNALKQIYKLLSTHSTLSSLSTHSTLSTTEYFSLLDEVVKPIGLDLYSEEEFKSKKRSMSIIIGNALSRNPIFKKRQVKGKNQYKVSFEELVSLLQAKGFLKPIKEILEVDKVDRGDSVASGMGKGQEEIDFSELDKEFEK